MKIKLNSSFFKMAYCLYYFTFFLEDLPLENTLNVDLLQIASYIRYFTYTIFILHLISQKLPLKNLVLLICIVLGGVLVAIGTSSFYWMILPIVILSATNENIFSVIKLSYRLLLILTIVVVVLSALEILPDILSYRTPFSPPRHSLGFYHSNVLPMVIFWLLSYKMILSSETEKISWFELVFWFVLTLTVNYLCDSRNGIFSVLLLLILYIIAKNKNSGTKFNTVLFWSSKYSTLVCIVFSFIAMFFQETKTSFWLLINSLSSGRFSAAYNQLKISGINLINLSPIDINYILDNGYLCVAFTFGIVFVFFYVITAFKLSKRYRNNLIVLIVSCIAAIVNIIDNDLTSYGYLPIILLAFHSKNLFGKVQTKET